MATVAVLQTDLLLNSAAFRTGMVAAAQTATTTLGQIQAEAQKTAASIDLMSKAAGAFIGFEAIKEGVSALIEAQIQMQQIHFTLVSATGSANGAADAFDFLKQKSAELGLNLQPAAQAFGQLAAAASASGIPMEQAQKLFTSFGEASTTLHLSSEQSQHALLALTEMMSRGTIQARQLNQQLGFAIPGSAARFKNAVMEAIKGTDLAGQSFEQLEKKGELVTARFMPQLIQALEESGRGYQEAAQGLNAQINRLKTSWFDLKNDMSSGLFNDVATSGIALVAQNMERIATAATIVGGLAVARLIGGQVDKGVSGISSAMQRRQELAEQAAAATQLADAEVAETAAQVRNNEAALAGVTVARDQAFTARQTAMAMYEQALAQNAAAQATLEHQRTAATLSANIRAEAIATAQAEAAQIALNKAQAQYDASIAASNALKEQQIIIDGRLLELRAANTAAIEMQTVANEAQAATTIGATLGRGLASAGSGLLALAGGPWGIAIAAAGALGYAIYDLKVKGDEWKKGTEEQATSLEQITVAAKEAAASFNTYADARNHSAGVQAFADDSKVISKTKSEIADLENQIKDLQDAMAQRGGGGPLAGMQLDELQTRLVTLQASLPRSSEAVDELGRKVSFGLLPAVDALKSGLDRLRAGSSLSGIWAGLASGFNAGNQALDDAKAKVDELQQAMAKLAQANEKDMKTRGKTQLQLQQQNLKDIEDAIKAQSNLTKAEQDAQIAAARTTAAPQLKLAASDDADRGAKKAATAAATAAREQLQAYQNLKNSQEGQLQSLKDQIDGDGKATSAQQKLNEMLAGGNAEFRHLSQAQKDEAIARQRRISNLTDEAKAQKDATKQAQAYEVVQENLARIAQTSARVHQDALNAIGQGTKETADAKALTDLVRQYNDLIAQAGRAKTKNEISGDTYDKEVTAYKAQLAEQLDADKAYFSQRDALQANWKNGAKSAFDNFRDSAANVAGETETLFTNAFNGMADALTTFATTGKMNFKGMVSSILTDLARMELRIVESKILQSIFAAFMPSGGGTFSNSSAIGGDSIGGGGFNFAAVSGGRAGGGPVSAGSLYQVNEKGPELLTTGGATYLMMGGQGGTVTPNGGSSAGSAGGSSITVNTTVVVQSNGQASSKTDVGGADKAAMGKQLGDMVTAKVQEGINRAMQPGGPLWQQRVGQAA